MPFDFINITIILSSILNIFLLYFLLGKIKYKVTSFREFLLSVLVTLGWCISMLIFRNISLDSAYLVFFTKILYFFPVFIPYFYILFIYYFPYKKNNIKLNSYLFIPPLVISLILIFTDTIIFSVEKIINSEKIITFNYLYFYLYIPYILFYFLLCFYIGYINIKNLNISIEKKQLQYILGGILISANISLFTNLILPSFGYFDLNWFGQFSNVIYIILVFITLFRYRFFEVKVVFKNIIILLLLLVFYWSLYLVFISFKINNYLYILFLVLSYPIIKDMLYKTSTQIWGNSKLNPISVGKIIKSMDNSYTHVGIFSNLEKNLLKYFNTKGLLLVMEDSILGEIATSKLSPKAIYTLYELLKNTKHDNIIVKYDIKYLEAIERVPEFKNFYKKIITLINNSSYEVLIPLYDNKSFLGILLLKEKHDNDYFSLNELSILENISHSLTINLSNANYYSKLRKFNATLQEQVQKATQKISNTNEILKVNNKKLKALDIQKTEFLSYASHELKTPLIAISNNLFMLEFLINKDLKKPKENEYIKSLFAQTNRLKRIVNNLLDISRIEQNKLSFNKEAIEIKPLLYNVLSNLKSLCLEKGLSFQNAVAEVTVIGDKDRIYEVFTNYISNAIKYSEKGIIRIYSEIQKDKVFFYVKDEGAGISKINYSKIFTKFGRASAGLQLKSKGASTGLGLYLTKKIIEELGGEVGFKSKLNVGSTFWFSLPIKK